MEIGEPEQKTGKRKKWRRKGEGDREEDGGG